ncbi:MAG: adventurous gliding motility lipoprotein CglC [Archangiaceae bacterium]|nr:adventurous gliding motility lipoprotein CglC [Archangiaceae bacterium]
MNRLGLAFIALSITAGCETTDLNRPCTLVRRNPDAGATALPIYKSDPVIKNSAQKDFISFGSTECEDQVCVRDSAFTEVDDGGFAQGYCSSSCVEDSSIGCQSYDRALDNDAKSALSCRTLLLDEATLAALNAKDPASYKRYFGMTMSPFFCARSPAVFDAGF